MSLFAIHSTSSNRQLVFSARDGEYFQVLLQGDVTATVNVWAYTDASRLLRLFQGLGNSRKPWQGEKCWGSIEDEFSISASCSSLGEVAFKIELRGLQGAPEGWRVNVGLVTEFGQLTQIARAAETFFQ